MAVGDFYRCTILGKLHGQDVQNVYHYREWVTGAGSGSSALGTLFDASVGSILKSKLSNEYTYTGVLTQMIGPGTPLVSDFYNGSAGAGGVVQNSLPTTVAATITKTTNFAGRKFRGRSYIAGLPTTYETDSNLNSTGLTALNVVASGISQTVAGVGGYEFRPIILHDRHTLSAYTAIVSAFARVPLRVQRRREVGVGS